MNRLGILGQVVPEDGRVVGMGKVSGRVPLLGVNEVGKFRRIAQEEDGSVVVDHVPVAFVRAEFD